MTPEYNGYLAHYGVQGQKWGVRQWQNEDGTYTEAGKQHYGWGNGYQRGPGSKNASAPRPQVPSLRAKSGQRYRKTSQHAVVYRRNEPSEQEKEARKAKTRRIIIAGAALTLAAIAAYKGSTRLRDKARAAEVNKRLQENHDRFVSTDWGKGTVPAYRTKLYVDRKIRETGSNITRRQAVSDFIRRRRWR